MANNSISKKYYYIRITENFYNREDIVMLESMEDGFKYSNLYQKMMLLSLKNDGRLLFKDSVPYNPMLLGLQTKFSKEFVEQALEIFESIGLIETLENGTIWMKDIVEFIGEDNAEALRKRKAENSQKLMQEKEAIKNGISLEDFNNELANKSPKKPEKCSKSSNKKTENEPKTEKTAKISEVSETLINQHSLDGTNISPPEIEIEKEIETEREIELEKKLEKERKLSPLFLSSPTSKKNMSDIVSDDEKLMLMSDEVLNLSEGDCPDLGNSEIETSKVPGGNSSDLDLMSPEVSNVTDSNYDELSICELLDLDFEDLSIEDTNLNMVNEMSLWDKALNSGEPLSLEEEMSLLDNALPFGKPAQNSYEDWEAVDFINYFNELSGKKTSTTNKEVRELLYVTMGTYKNEEIQKVIQDKVEEWVLSKKANETTLRMARLETILKPINFARYLEEIEFRESKAEQEATERAEQKKLSEYERMQIEKNKPVMTKYVILENGETVTEEEYLEMKKNNTKADTQLEKIG